MDPRCPVCGTDYVRRARASGLLDFLLLPFFFQPFRCQLCAQRFRFFGRRYPADRREYQRSVSRFPTMFSGGQKSGKGVISDISMGGCSLETDTKLFMGCLLRLQVQVSDNDPVLAIDAAVVRSLRPKAVGLRFMHVKGDERERLRKVVRKLYEEFASEVLIAPQPADHPD
jgi:PilZ domain